MSSVQAAPRADYAEIIRRLKDIEAETLWSHSYTRRLLIATLTYLIVCIYLYETESLDPFIEAVVPTLGYLLSTLGLDTVRPYLWRSSATPQHPLDPEALVSLASTATPIDTHPAKAKCKDDRYDIARSQSVASIEEIYDSDGDASAADTEAVLPRVLRQGSSDSYFGTSIASNAAPYTPCMARMPSSPDHPRSPLHPYKDVSLMRQPNPRDPRPPTPSLLGAAVLLHVSDSSKHMTLPRPRHTGGKLRNRADDGNNHLAIEDSITVPPSAALTPRRTSSPYDEWSSHDAEIPRSRGAAQPSVSLLPRKKSSSPELDRADSDTAPLLLLRDRASMPNSDASLTQQAYTEKDKSNDEIGVTDKLLGLRPFFISKAPCASPIRKNTAAPIKGTAHSAYVKDAASPAFYILTEDSLLPQSTPSSTIV